MQTSYTESIMGQARVKMPIVLDRFYFLQKLSRGGVRQLRYWIARSPKRCILGSFPKAVLRPLNLTGAKMTLSIKTKSFESRLGRPLIIHQITKWNLCYVVRNIRFTSSGIVITHLQSSGRIVLRWRALRETSSRLPKTSAGPGWTHSRLWNV